MSAYIVDRAHIIYLVEAAMNHKISDGLFYWYPKDKEPQKLGVGDYQRAVEVRQMLWNECILSVSFRYDGGPVSGLPGVIGEDYQLKREDFSGDVYSVVDPVQILKAVRCYCYQSCEHPEWESSEAKVFVDTLASHAISILPGYKAAKWGAPKENKEEARS